MHLRGLLTFTLLFVFFASFSQKLYEDQIDVSSTKNPNKKNAIIYLPKNYSKSKAYPLVLFTHGIGESGKNIKKMYKQGLPLVLKKGYKPSFDFIMVAVQSTSFSVSPLWLDGILKECQKRWKIDASRIYLTGLSAGGWSIYGSQLNFNPAFAKKFAAIVVNSGVTTNINKNHLDWWKETKTPVWAIVGGADRSYVTGNTYMVNEINKRVPRLASLTIRPGVGHGGWSDIYNGKVKLNGKNMWEWLYQFKRTASGSTGSKPPVEEVPLPPAKGDSADVKEPVSDRKYIKVSIFKGSNAGTNDTWNNWNVGAAASTNISSGKFKYDDGAATSVAAVLSSSYEVVDNEANYGGGVAPAGVLRYSSYDVHQRTLTIKGLSKAKSYNVYLYASRHDRPNNTTVFTVGSQSYGVATNNNHLAGAMFMNLKADAQGRIVVTINNLNRYNYLNGFKIVEIAGTSGK